MLKNILQSSKPSMSLLAQSSKVLPQSSLKHGHICHSNVEEDTKVNGIGKKKKTISGKFIEENFKSEQLLRVPENRVLHTQDQERNSTQHKIARIVSEQNKGRISNDARQKN